MSTGTPPWDANPQREDLEAPAPTELELVYRDRQLLLDALRALVLDADMAPKSKEFRAVRLSLVEQARAAIADVTRRKS